MLEYVANIRKLDLGNSQRISTFTLARHKGRGCGGLLRIGGMFCKFKASG